MQKCQWNSVQNVTDENRVTMQTRKLVPTLYFLVLYVEHLSADCNFLKRIYYFGPTQVHYYEYFFMHHELFLYSLCIGSFPAEIQSFLINCDSLQNCMDHFCSLIEWTIHSGIRWVWKRHRVQTLRERDNLGTGSREARLEDWRLF